MEGFTRIDLPPSIPVSDHVFSPGSYKQLRNGADIVFLGYRRSGTIKPVLMGTICKQSQPKNTSLSDNRNADNRRWNSIWLCGKHGKPSLSIASNQKS